MRVLEETLRELQVEFEVQRKSKSDLERQKNCLSEELTDLKHIGPDSAASSSPVSKTIFSF